MVSDQKALAVINEYAPKIIEAHKGVQGNATTMMEHAIAAGELLIKAKKKVGHGKWAEWVTENCHFSDRTARDYMRMAEHKKQIGRDLPISICGALAKLAKPKSKAKKDSKEGKPHSEPENEPQPALSPDDYRHTEEDVAASIVRNVETEVAAWESDGLDLDLVRELIMQKLKFAFAGKEETPAVAAPKKKPGRPKGSRNKSKASNGTEPATGNGVDADTSADARKAANEAAFATPDGGVGGGAA